MASDQSTFVPSRIAPPPPPVAIHVNGDIAAARTRIVLYDTIFTLLRLCSARSAAGRLSRDDASEATQLWLSSRRRTNAKQLHPRQSSAIQPGHGVPCAVS